MSRRVLPVPAEKHSQSRSAQPLLGVNRDLAASSTGAKLRERTAEVVQVDENMSLEKSSVQPHAPTGVVVTREYVEQHGSRDEQARRRREQYKRYQQQYRARHMEKIASLGHDVDALHSEIASLEDEWEACVLSQPNCGVFTSRGSNAGAPARVVMEFYRVYEYGYLPPQSEFQEHFLRSITLENVAGIDYQGTDALLEQLQLYSQLFAYVHQRVNGLNVATVGDLTIVQAHVVITMHATRRGVMCLYPNINANEEAVQVLVASVMEVFGCIRFVFDADGQVALLSGDMDFVSTFLSMFGTLESVSRCVECARMSLSTGHISPSCTVGLSESTPSRLPPLRDLTMLLQ